MIKEYDYPSKGTGMIHARCWMPACKPIAVVQLVHGIAEHAQRYDHFASFLNELGFLVVAQDHMGHGKSCSSQQAKGYFYGGWFAAVEDVRTLMTKTMEEYSDIPYFLFGHSMGSFLVRTLIIQYPNCGIAGAVICGTGWMPGIALSVGKRVCSAICRLYGEQRPYAPLQKLIFGGYNKSISNPRTEFDWLSHDHEDVDRYIADEMCGFTVTPGLFRDMLSAMQYIQDMPNLRKMDTSLPVFLIGGAEDPVGDYGKGVGKTASEFQKAGMDNVRCCIYANCRHEILNELQRQTVYHNVAAWLKNYIV